MHLLHFIYCNFILFIVIMVFPSVWGDSSAAGSESAITGFGESDGFDSFLSMTAPPSDMKVKRAESAESDEGPDFSVFIK